MSLHWHKVKQPKGTPSPPATVVDLNVSLLSPSDEETLLRFSGTQCQLCSKVFSARDSLRKHMREHREKNVLSKPVEEAAGLALAIAGGSCNVLLSPVKHKRSKRGAPPLKFNEMDAAASLLLLSEHFSKVRSTEFKKPKGCKCSAYDICYGQCVKDNNLIPNFAKEKTSIPNIAKHSACEDCFGQCEKDSSLIPNVDKKERSLIANVPKKYNTLISIVLEEVDLNVLDHVLAGDAELRKKQRTDNSVEMKCADFSAAVKVKRHQCNACGKSFGSGSALGGHMRWHLPRSNDRRHGFVESPDSVVMKEQKQKLELDTKFLDLRLPGLTDITIFSGLKSEPEPWRVASSVH
uniref:C2H2-type domain-containing protein n=1 Tax=Aegilops tauschii TaxID=37682 RepID=R7WFX5_AEGTA